MRQSTIAEQSLSEQHALWILVAPDRNRRDRLLAGAGGPRLGVRRRGSVEASQRQ
jgi:hypothetical protein